MATTLTNMVDDVLVIDAIQGALKNSLPSLKAFALGIETTGKVQNDVVRVPVLGAATASTKTPGTASTSGGSVATTPVTIDTYKESSWQLNEGQANAARAPKIFAGLAAEATYAVVKYVIDAVCGLVTAANFDNADTDKLVVAPADMGMNDIGTLWQKAEDKKLGRMRSLIMNSAYTGQLIGNSNLGLILATLGDKALLTAQLPPLLGFNALNYSGLSDNSENLGGFVTDQGALGVALAPPEALVSAGEGNKISDVIITDPDSQIVVRYITMSDADAGYIKGRVEVMYGVAKIQNSVIRLLSA